MEILGINASPRGPKSQTLRLTQAVLNGAKSSGARVELVDVCNLNINYCNGCQVCYRKGVCIHEDDFQGLFDKILASDGLVWGSPNYLRSITAQMKTLVDRMSDAIHCQLLTGKYSCIVCSGGGNFDQVTDYMSGVLLNFGSFVTGSTGAIISQGPKSFDEAEKKAFDLGKTLAEDISIKRDYVEQREMLEDTREYFKKLVRIHEKDWEHEYEYWNRLNWR